MGAQNKVHITRIPSFLDANESLSPIAEEQDEIEEEDANYLSSSSSSSNSSDYRRVRPCPLSSSSSHRRRSRQRSTIKTQMQRKQGSATSSSISEADDLIQRVLQLINETRAAAQAQQQQKKDISPLQLSPHLCRIAHWHAHKTMLAQKKVCHSVTTATELQNLLQCKHVGENVQAGRTIEDMHQATVMKADDGSNNCSVSRRNILSSQFNQVGIAVAVSEEEVDEFGNPTLYLCQLFRYSSSLAAAKTKTPAHRHHCCYQE